MGSLYEAGWRQGGLLRHRLPVTWLEWSQGSGIVQRGTEHELWVVATQDCDLDALDEAVKLKTWLGRRYDRPAVPPEVVDLRRAIAAAVKGHRVGDVAARVRDMLWQFEPGEPPLFSLYAVVEDEGIRDQARQWLTTVGLSVPRELGVPVVMEAATAERISLRLIETSYSADVSDLTWGRGEPKGAY